MFVIMLLVFRFWLSSNMVDDLGILGFCCRLCGGKLNISVELYSSFVLVCG